MFTVFLISLVSVKYTRLPHSSRRDFRKVDDSEIEDGPIGGNFHCHWLFFSLFWCLSNILIKIVG